MGYLEDELLKLLQPAVERVELSGEGETVNVMPVVAGCEIGPAFDAMRSAIRTATTGRRVLAELDAIPVRHGGVARVALRRMEDAEVLRRELDEARAEVERLRAMPRPGQALFNALAVIAPGFAEEIRGTDLDPFHDDTRIAACLAAWRGDLLEDAAIGAAIGPRVEEMRRVLATTKGGA